MKKLFVLILALALTLSLAACGSGNNTNTGGNSGNNPTGANSTGSPTSNGGDNTGAFAYGNGKDYIANHLKGDYSITYTVKSSDSSDTAVQSITKTAAGYYMVADGSESLFIKNGSQYDVYSGSKAEGFTKSGAQLSQEMVDTYTTALMTYMTYYGAYESGMKSDGSQAIAGRSCDQYTFDYAIAGASIKYVCCIDKETGVCLKLTYAAAAGGQGGSMTFECTDFKTSGVSLPTYN